MIHDLLKIIKEAEDMLDNQSQQLSDFDEKLRKVYRDLKDINEILIQADSKNNSTNKD